MVMVIYDEVTFLILMNVMCRAMTTTYEIDMCDL